jgi:hypothetical protein
VSLLPLAVLCQSQGKNGGNQEEITGQRAHWRWKRHTQPPEIARQNRAEVQENMGVPYRHLGLQYYYVRGVSRTCRLLRPPMWRGAAMNAWIVDFLGNLLSSIVYEFFRRRSRREFARSRSPWREIHVAARRIHRDSDRIAFVRSMVLRNRSTLEPLSVRGIDSFLTLVARDRRIEMAETLADFIGPRSTKSPRASRVFDTQATMRNVRRASKQHPQGMQGQQSGPDQFVCFVLRRRTTRPPP